MVECKLFYQLLDILLTPFIQNQSQKYPVLSLLARDYLAIQGSSVASERAFSSGGRTGTALRNRLKPETFEALQLLKDAYRTGLISASSAMEAQAVGVLWDDDFMVEILGDPEEAS